MKVLELVIPLYRNRNQTSCGVGDLLDRRTRDIWGGYKNIEHLDRIEGCMGIYTVKRCQMVQKYISMYYTSVFLISNAWTPPLNKSEVQWEHPGHQYFKASQ